MVLNYIHYPLNQEITAIGGHYLFTKEMRLSHQGREILYRVASATIDTSCCGVGGLVYVLVPGYILGWHTAQTRDGLPISQVEPITALGVRKKIERLIKSKEMVQQVNFE